LAIGDLQRLAKLKIQRPPPAATGHRRADDERPAQTQRALIGQRLSSSTLNGLTLSPSTSACWPSAAVGPAADEGSVAQAASGKARSKSKPFIGRMLGLG
jgi:hypothetical protein